ncbi:MAG: DUF2809 domain-containing protein [Pseudomonadota bacterium]
MVQDGRRIGYFAAASILFALLAMIALGLKGGVVRTHGGDLLVVAWLYCLVRAVFLLRPSVSAAFVVALAFLIEVGQAFALIERLGLGEAFAAELALGRHFDPFDLIAYALGGAGAFLADRYVTRRF